MPNRGLGLLLAFNCYWVSWALLLCLALPAVVLATPSRGVTRNNTCSACHLRPVTDRMRVTSEDLQLALLLPTGPSAHRHRPQSRRWAPASSRAPVGPGPEDLPSGARQHGDTFD